MASRNKNIFYSLVWQKLVPTFRPTQVNPPKINWLVGETYLYASIYSTKFSLDWASSILEVVNRRWMTHGDLKWLRWHKNLWMHFRNFTFISLEKGGVLHLNKLEILLCKVFFVLSLVEIGMVVLEEKMKIWKDYDDNQQISIRKAHLTRWANYVCKMC